MLEKMLGVSPPQKGLAQDSGAVDKKTLQQQAELKKEFDQKLKQQLKERPQNSAASAKDSKPDQKAKLEDKDELRADRNQKKPSGGSKKKMVEPEEQDDTTISKIMASNESEVEIADQRKDLAPVESESFTEIKNEGQTGINPALQPVGQNANAVATLVAKANTVPTEKSVVTDDALLQQVLNAKTNAKTTAVEITPEMIAAFRAAQKNTETETSDSASVTDDSQLALQMQQMANQANQASQANPAAGVGASAPDTAKVADPSSLVAKSLENLKAATAGVQAEPVAVTTTAAALAALGFGIGAKNSDVDQDSDQQPVTKGLADANALENFEMQPTTQLMQNIQQAQPEMTEPLTFDQQLQAEVGFEPEADENEDVSKSALLQKMKAFEADKGLTPKEANSFEIKVLALLQQERNAMAHQKNGAGEGSSGGKGSEFSHKENQSDTPSDSMKDLGSQTLQNPDSSLHAGQTQPGFKSHLAAGVERAGAPLSPEAMAEHREENIQHVMSSAKLLAIKGGGEMTVKMSPDGMGPIELKVMMQDGKVNIQMQTQDKAVKKLIEDSLTELKSGLAAQKIHVDHVKIDTVNATNTENSASFQPQQGSSDAQGRQQEFWKQFRENFGNQARKNSYGEVAATPTRQQATPGALQPVTTSAARNGARTGSTINRVA